MVLTHNIINYHRHNFLGYDIINSKRIKYVYRIFIVNNCVKIIN